METNIKKIFGYCRESTRDQINNGYNIDDQEKKIRKYVQYIEVDFGTKRVHKIVYR